MRRFIITLSILLTAGLLAACGKVEVTTNTSTASSDAASGGARFKTRGFEFLVPSGSSHTDGNADGFTYKSDQVTFSVVKNQLSVDGKNYGAVKQGDQVNVRTKGKVLVNGSERKSL